MFKIKIVPVEETDAPLYHKYPGQTSAQGAYVELDLICETLGANWNADIGNAVTFNTWQGHEQRWQIPCLTSGRDINGMLEGLQPHCEEILEGYERVWDGSNHVAEFTERAQEAIEYIERFLQDWRPDQAYLVEDWGGWFGDGVYDALEIAATCYNAQDFNADVKEDFFGSAAVLDNSQDPSEYVVDKLVQLFDDCCCGHLDVCDCKPDRFTLEESLPPWLREEEEIQAAIKKWKE